MASHFGDNYRALSRLLHEEARALGVFDHPTAKGDGREALVRRVLSERVGTTFGVTKAEVVDSHGGTSGEIDAVIYDQSVASCLGIMGERRVVRAEAVVAAIEVKSHFSLDWLTETQRIENGIGSLKRHYRPTPLNALFAALQPPGTGAEALWSIPTEHLSTLDNNHAIPAVVSAYFGFKGPSIQKIQTFVETPLIDAVCILGEYTVAKKRVGFNKRANGTEDAKGFVWGRGDDALGAFLQVIETALVSVLDSRTLFQPSPRYYLPPSQG